jgi:N-acetylglutamate synthase-like GNAT family acetyltransferase
MHQVKISKSATQLEAILVLRYNILRQPWNQPAETATDDLEEKSINAFIEDANGIVIACARLQENENQVGQVRYMAVHEDYQGKGLGKLILQFLEEEGRKLGLAKMELQARENAVQFYEANHYKIREKTFLLWGIIQHYLMVKQI